MAVQNVYKRLPLEHIIVKRDERQRKVIDTSSIIESVRTRGVLSPILVHREPDNTYTLIYGERRLTASREIGYTDIPCRIANELDQVELKIIELEENLRRDDLPWQDHVAAVAELHDLWCEKDIDHTQAKSAERLNYTTGQMTMFLRVADDLENPQVIAQTGLASAYNLLTRKDERRLADDMADILDAAQNINKPPQAPVPAGAKLEPGRKPDPETHVKSAHRDILNENFLLWAPNYTGQPFNLIHCDFPYGINYNAGPQSGSTKWNTYKDSPDIYWALVCALCDNLDRIMAPSAHIMFWLSADVEIMFKTLECFREFAPSLAFTSKPLIWHKTDNVGILSDPKRGPRHIYETCLMASREDRLIIRAVSDTYGAPTDKAHHPSAKPEPVLRQFMQMFADENTRMLDPTCGGGSSLRAAESLGAKQVLGLEIDPEHCANARSALRQFRSLRSALK